ncbi:hypothetical protein FRC03_005901, partial [Tulasnella sp. 419]
PGSSSSSNLLPKSVFSVEDIQVIFARHSFPPLIELAKSVFNAQPYTNAGVNLPHPPPPLSHQVVVKLTNLHFSLRRNNDKSLHILPHFPPCPTTSSTYKKFQSGSPSRQYLF